MLWANRLIPTEHFTISKPWNSSINVFEQHEICSLTDFKALKFQKSPITRIRFLRSVTFVIRKCRWWYTQTQFFQSAGGYWTHKSPLTECPLWGAVGKGWGNLCGQGSNPATPRTEKQAGGFSPLLLSVLGSCQWNWVVADATASFAGPFWNQLGVPTP